MKEDDFVNISLKLYHADLHYHMFLVIILPELRRRTPLAFLEYSVEIRDIIESTMIANLHNSHGTVGKQSSSMAKSDVDDIFRYTLIGAQLEETAECRGCHGHETCKSLEPYLLTIVRVYVFLYFLHPATVCRHTDMSKRT